MQVSWNEMKEEHKKANKNAKNKIGDTVKQTSDCRGNSHNKKVASSILIRITQKRFLHEYMSLSIYIENESFDSL